MVFKKGNQLYKKRHSYKGGGNPFYGKQHSKESKIKMGAKKGSVPWNKDKKGIYSEGAIQKMREAKKDYIPWNNDLHGEEYLKHYRNGVISNWNGGCIPYYGHGWKRQRKRVLKRAEYKSELSGKNGRREPDIHHIYNAKTFLKKYLKLCFVPYIPKIKICSFSHKYHHDVLIPPDTVFIKLIMDEMNNTNNLIALTATEHGMLENMPPSFFYNILYKKKKREEN